MGISRTELSGMSLDELKDATEAWNAANGDGEQLTDREAQNLGAWLDSLPTMGNA